MINPFLILVHIRLCCCVAKHVSSIIIKFADDTTIIGLITGNDETAYREEVMALYEWCLENNLTLNISKTREMIVDYRKRPVREHQPIHINGVKVERVSSFKFLGVNITEDFSWTLHTDTAIRKARQWLYFLRKLRKFGMNANITSNFYRCAIESLLTSCITVWYGSCSASSRKSLQRVVKAAEHITGTRLPAIQDIYLQRCLRKAHSIIKDHSCHGPGEYGVFPLRWAPPSGRDSNQFPHLVPIKSPAYKTSIHNRPLPDLLLTHVSARPPSPCESP
ncbi:uncharacterized protein LOC143419457 [Maylandia zebra]|uniref:uncharacterized protein LOC143419457 n=1 Tax=Maylandia zebra TaxID=106582 RepID=UPI00403CCF43